MESIDTTAVEDETDESDADDSLVRDDIFHILQCRRRRLVLKYLQEHGTPAKMTDVTEHIAAVEHDTTVAALKSQERQRVYIALYQSHLPKLDEEGVIEYQQNRGIVERTERTAEFDKYLDEEPSMRDDDATEQSPTERSDAGADHDAAESERQLSRSTVGVAGLALAAAVSVYASLPSTAVPLGVGVAIAALTVVAIVATSAVSDDDDSTDDQ